jgi:phosphocarrier protein
MKSREVTVINRLGLHARAASRFVHLASTFQSDVNLSRGSRTVDGKSIMGVMLLSAGTGTSLTVSTDGSDEDTALDTLCGFVANGFGEDSCSA